MNEEGLEIFEANKAYPIRQSREISHKKPLTHEKRKYSFRRKSTITTNSDDKFFDSFIDNEFTLIE